MWAQYFKRDSPTSGSLTLNIALRFEIKQNNLSIFCGKMSSESSPSKSYQEKLEWFFGIGIPFLDPSRIKSAC